LRQPAGHSSLDAAQDTVGLLACEHTLVAHVQFFIQQYPQVLLGRAALNPFIPQPVFLVGVAPTHVQDLALGLLEPHEVCTGPFLKLEAHFSSLNVIFFRSIDTEGDKS